MTCKDDCVEISITSDSLSRDFELLVRSLGIMDTVIVKKAGYISVDGKRHSLGNWYKHFLKVPDNIDFQRLEVHLGERIISQRGFIEA